MGPKGNTTMTKEINKAEVQSNTAKATEKKAKVILRKPAGAKENQGWTGEVINPDKTRYFVPESFKEGWTEEELAMTKVGNLVKAIADSTAYAAKFNLDYSAIIGKHGIECITAWDAYTKAVKARKDKRDSLTGTTQEKKDKWETIKGPFNSAVRVQMLKMELLTEKILAGEPKKALN